jgi:hypothetical protein
MTRPLRQLTLRGFEPRLDQAIAQTAQREGISLNQAALRLMRRGAGLDPSSETSSIGASLDDLIGTWSRREAEHFMEGIESCRQFDEDLWR